jgi:hypothetical protein
MKTLNLDELKRETLESDYVWYASDILENLGLNMTELHHVLKHTDLGNTSICEHKNHIDYVATKQGWAEILDLCPETFGVHIAKCYFN